eukprot:2871843-Amphidinium_carterae.1
MEGCCKQHVMCDTIVAPSFETSFHSSQCECDNCAMPHQSACYQWVQVALGVGAPASFAHRF